MPAKYKVQITKTAQQDVEDIWSYIATDSPAQAQKFIKELLKQASTLARFPTRCPIVPENELLGTSYRHLLYGDYRTVFRVDEKSVYVLRIFHGSKLLDESVFNDTNK